MRVNIISQGGQGGGGLSITGATLTGPLTLFQDPVDLLEAATKQYVDLAANALSASKITTGILSTTRLPAFSGDLTSAAGDNTLTLTNTTVTPGTYTKVTVDTKGRITAGANLVAADIPNLDYSKITSGKPTTLLGFGITDGVNLTGDNLTGALTLNANPSTGLNAATKQYVDTAVSSASIVPVGGTIRRLYNTAPTNYLRTNGALISKTGYASLYAVIGNTEPYNVAGGGQPWTRQYQLNTQQSAALGSWSTGTAFPILYQGDCAVTKNYVYAIGGGNDSGVLSSVYVASIASNGTLGAWTAATSLPAAAIGHRPIVTKNYIYLLGNTSTGVVTSTTVYMAPINADGTLGAWTTSAPYPLAVTDTQAFITKNRVYVCGGYQSSNATRYDNVYTAVINTDGTLGTWTPAGVMPSRLSGHRSILTKNRVYIFGGFDNANNIQSAVYMAPINSDGTLGSWTTVTAFPSTISECQTFVTRNRAYVFGGRLTNSTTYNANVYSAPVNLDGTLGTWTQETTSMPAARLGSLVFATSSRLYCIGGSSGSANTNTAYYALISGGLNDYSPYYDGTVVAVDPLVFQIPDTTTTDPAGVYTFIRYQ